VCAAGKRARKMSKSQQCIRQGPRPPLPPASAADVFSAAMLE
jgi:hypothetical protein